MCVGFTITAVEKFTYVVIYIYMYMYTPAVIKMEGGTDHDLLSLETTSTKGEEDKNEEGNKEEGKLAEGEGGEGTSTSQFPPPPPPSPPPSPSPFTLQFLLLPFLNPLHFFLPSPSTTLVSIPPFTSPSLSSPAVYHLH